ncbi:hypothetical protein BP5796_04476 [Coleophoma crateriformis]|uniref:Mid2 domain-containing protein n=1 Tax=Coleophoma crateriformis TaxID=565419 RepID=A0A3D8S9F7_9HELO|nr:hypothetical protein BP5796_04476 [Coleophoma crateriformis]
MATQSPSLHKMHIPVFAARKHLFLAIIIHGLTNALLFEPTRTQSGLLASCTAIGSEPTDPAKSIHHELKPRQAGSQNAICGWIDGNSGSAVSCGGSFYCATEQSFVGCCPTSSCVGIVTACYDILGAICDAACQQDLGNLVCRSSLPYCATYNYPGGSVGYGCALATGYTKSVLLTYTTGPGSFSPSSISSSSSTSTSVLNSSPTASTTTSPSPKKGISGGAIAGIIIGSVATVALMGTLVWWLMRSRKEKTRGDHSPQPLQNVRQSQHQVQRQLAHTSNLSGSTEAYSPGYKYGALAQASPPPDSTIFAGSGEVSLPARTSPYGSDFSGAGPRNSQHLGYRGPTMPEMSGDTNQEQLRPRSTEY